MKRRILFVFLAILLCLVPLFSEERVDHFAQVVDRSGEKGKLTAYFIDLDVPSDSKDKSGDCTILISPEGKVMMVDCGHPDAGKDVVKVLKALGIDHIDIFVNSHPHIDHLGAFPQIAQVCSIGQVYRSLVEYDTSYTRNFASTIEKKGIPVQMLAEGDGFLFGENVRVDVLWPEKGPVEYPKNYPGNGATQFLNDHSLALQLTFGESKLLLCGDLYRAGERAVLDGHGAILQSDVAKANHHGNDTSNQRSWIKAVKPQVVVAMNDVMGSMDVYNDFRKYGATFYHTLYNGTIRVRLDEHHHVEVTPQFESWVEKSPNQ